MNELMTYVMTDGELYKIGQSINPKKRMAQLRSGNHKIGMVFFGIGVTEKELHKIYRHKRIALEWFNLNEEDLNNICGMFTTLGDNSDVGSDDLAFPRYVIGVNSRIELKKLLNAESVNDKIVDIFIYLLSSYYGNFSMTNRFMKYVSKTLDIKYNIFKDSFKKMEDLDIITSTGKDVYIVKPEIMDYCKKYIKYI